jgi:potassium-dependent mechanosensitive channel
MVRKLHRALCSWRVTMMITLAVLLFSPVPGFTAEEKATEHQNAPASQKEAVPAPSEEIPMAEVALRSTEASDFFQTLNKDLASSGEVESIQKELQKARMHIDLDLTRTTAISDGATLARIQAHQQVWLTRQAQTTGWLNKLTDRGSRLESALNRLADMQKTWTRTRKAAEESGAPAITLRQIDTTLAAIQAAQPSLNSQLAAVFDLQSEFAHDVTLCTGQLEQIARIQKAAMEGILARTSLPIWNPELWAEAKKTVPSVLSEAAYLWQGGILEYVTDRSKKMPLHLGILLGLMVILLAGRRQVKHREGGGEKISSAMMVFYRPYAAAFFGALFLASSPFSTAPFVIKGLFGFLLIAPLIRVVKPVLDPGLMPVLYALGILYPIDFVARTLNAAPLLDATTLLFETLVAIGLLGWSVRRGYGRFRLLRQPASTSVTVYRWVSFLCLAILFGGFLAALSGYLRLSRLLTSEILAGSLLALALYASVRIVTGIVALGLRVWPLRHLEMVSHHHDLLVGRTHRLLVWAAVFGFVIRSLDFLGLFDPTVSFAKSLLALKLERGSISISVSDVVIFLLTVWIAYLASAFLRFVLEEDVYPRMGVPRGLRYATSSLLNYIILAVGVVVAMGMVGVNLTRVSVLAGAFGVGIGFGLQSVVNNFVSGLILLFERPVHVGDTIEVGDLQGEVRRIGIRASTVRTWQGSDIIVPNAQFITEKVTNWTLSDLLMRIDLPVGVSYGTDPSEVIRMLEQVARAHPEVLADPAPRAFFMGFGDSSLNFEVRAWTDHYLERQKIRSELAIGVYDAARAAGMSFPFPQREVRLLRDPVEGEPDKARGTKGE